MAAGIYNFTIEQGTTFTRTFKYKDANGDPVDLSSHAVRMQIRKNIGGDLISSFTEEGTDKFTVGGTGNNEFTLSISASTTASYTFSTAVYDIEIELGGVVTRLLQGKIKLSKEVTI
jgi:hypothetical protein